MVKERERIYAVIGVSTLNVILVGLLQENNKTTPKTVAFLISVFIVVKTVCRLGLRTAYWHYLEEKR